MCGLHDKKKLHMGQKLLFLTKQVEIQDGIWYVEYREL